MIKILTHAKRAIRGHIFYMQDVVTPVEFSDGILVWNVSGEIIACGEYTQLLNQLPKDLPIDDWSGKLVVPGFVDCHTHLPQLDCRNKAGLTLLDWLNKHIYPAESAFYDINLARSVARRFFEELLRNGTTTAMIYCSIHEEATDIAFEEADRAGMRTVIGKVMMDQNCPDALKEKTSESLKKSERLLLKWHGHRGRLFYAMTPRFAVTCSRKLIEGAGRIAQDSGAYFQTHFAETTDEVALAKEIHGITKYVGFYGDCRCLGAKAMYAHCLYPENEGWSQLAESCSAVAHCPSSNIFLKSGRMPYEVLMQHGIRCGLGSDVAAGPKFSLWDVVRCGQAQHTQKKFSDTEGFYRATLGGAEAMGFADVIGSFHIGKLADVAIFDVSSFIDAIDTTPTAAATYIRGQRC